MQASIEIMTLRRRLTRLESELFDLKLALHQLERKTEAEAEAAATIAAPTETPVTPDPSISAAGLTQIASAPTEVPIHSPSASLPITEAAPVSPIESAPVQPVAAAVTPAMPPPLPVEPPVAARELAPEQEAWLRPAARREEAASVPVVEPEPESSSPQPNPLREWLEPLQLWPPTGEENAEVRLAAWWATRLGALFAVIGVVFLGAYISQGSPPWVRLVEVMGVTAAVLALGNWLVRKLPKFGAVVFGAGLALAYFTGFAAYDVPAMKVITSPAIATVVQLVVVGGIFATAWRRNSPVVATMSVVLGYVTAFLALRGEPVGFGAWVVLLLGAVAVMLRLTRQWDAPSALAMPLTWLYLAVAAISPTPGREMAVHAVWMWSALHLALFMARDWIAAWRGQPLGTFDRALQVVNSSLAVTVGLMAALRAGGSTATHFYFGSGVLMLGCAWAWRYTRVGVLVPIFVCKGTGLIALGVIDAFAGQMRCLVLLAQAFAMLVSARNAHQRWLKTATLLVGAVAFAFFLHEMRLASAPFAARETILEVVFLASALGFVAALQRWLGFSASAVAGGSLMIATTAVVVVSNWQLHGWAPAAHVGMAVVLAAAALLARAWLPALIAAAVLVAAGHGHVWLWDARQHPAMVLWWSEVSLLAAAVVGGLGTARVVDVSQRLWLRWAIGALSSLTLVVAFTKGMPVSAALAAGTGLGALLVVAARRSAGWPFAALAAPVMTLAFFLSLTKFMLLGPGAGEPGRFGADAWWWVAAAIVWLPALWLTLSRTVRESIGSEPWRNGAPALHTLLATCVTLIPLLHVLEGNARIVGASLAAMTVLAFVWRPGLRSGWEASWVFWGLAAVTGLLPGTATGSGLAAVACWLAAIAWVTVPALGEYRQQPAVHRRHAHTLQVVFATALALVALSHVPATHALVTAAAASLAALLIAGIFRLRPALEASWVLAWAAVAQATRVGESAPVLAAAAMSWSAAILLVRVPRFAALREGPAFWRMHADAIQAAFATVLTLYAVNAFHGAAQVYVATAGALVAFGLAAGLGVKPALEASWVLWASVLARVAQTELTPASWLASGLAWLPAIVLVRIPALQALHASPPAWRKFAPDLQTVLAAAIGVAAAMSCSAVNQVLAFATLAGLALAVWRWGGVAAARPAAVGLASAGWLCAARLALGAQAQGWTFGFAVVLGFAALFATLPFLVQRELGTAERRALRWFSAVGGLMVAFTVLIGQHGELAPYATVGCGLAAVALFLLGLFTRSRPHRLTGLGGLAFCIPRAFFVDLNSTVYRIAAFVALGLVLLWVGFSYHRFRHLIVEDESAPKT